MPESRAAGAGFDWFGSALFVSGLTAVMFGLLEAPQVGWGSPVVVGAFVVGAVALCWFSVVQRRTAVPVLAPELVGDRRFMGWCLATLTTSIGFLGVLVFLPTYLQGVVQVSSATAGVVMLLLTAPVLVTPLMAVRLVNRGTSARTVIAIALAFVVIGNIGLLALGPENTIPRMALPLLLIGVGMGASFGITDGQAMGVVPTRLLGAAAGFLNTMRGAAEAIVIAVFSAALVGLLTARVDSPDEAAQISAGNLRSDDPTSRGEHVVAFTQAWHVTQVGVGLVCLVLSAVVAYLLFAPARESSTGSQ